MRWVVRIGAGLVVFVVLAAGTVFALTEQRLGRGYQVADWKGKAPPVSDALALEHGKHVAQTRGCLDCHKADGRGGLFADAMPVMRLVPRNITPGGVTANYSDADWERAVRHCVRPDGTPIPFMPCLDNARLSDADLGALITYLRTLPAIADHAERTTIGPVGRVLYLAGALPYAHAELIDHGRIVPEPPPVGPTAAYGAYLADMCTGCHGEHLSGGAIPGVPPEWPAAANLTPDATGLGAFSEADFARVLRTGVRLDGRRIEPQYMPWNQFRLFTDDEVKALWLHLRALPPRAAGGR